RIRAPQPSPSECLGRISRVLPAPSFCASFRETRGRRFLRRSFESWIALFSRSLGSGHGSGCARSGSMGILRFAVFAIVLLAFSDALSSGGLFLVTFAPTPQNRVGPPKPAAPPRAAKATNRR